AAAGGGNGGGGAAAVAGPWGAAAAAGGGGGAAVAVGGGSYGYYLPYFSVGDGRAVSTGHYSPPAPHDIDNGRVGVSSKDWGTLVYTPSSGATLLAYEHEDDAIVAEKEFSRDAHVFAITFKNTCVAMARPIHKDWNTEQRWSDTFDKTEVYKAAMGTHPTYLRKGLLKTCNGEFKRPCKIITVLCAGQSGYQVLSNDLKPEPPITVLK
ncbi:DUF4189 domain-containing protein, partial [bacterium]|nr:DUF4189 domain-containing protein [bacterium]